MPLPKQKPIIATMTFEGADDVADYLRRVLDTACPKPMIEHWRTVISALDAITNDTDAIVINAAHLLEHAAYRIVHQPGCSNVISMHHETDDLSVHGGRGYVSILFQGGRNECDGYLRALVDRGGRSLPAVICLPGDCTKLDWVLREPPVTWSRDCHEWADPN